MGGRYLVTMIPGRMEMYWGCADVCHLYGNVLAVYVSDVCETSWLGMAHKDENTLKPTPEVLVLTPHANKCMLIILMIQMLFK